MRPVKRFLGGAERIFRTSRSILARSSFDASTNARNHSSFVIATRIGPHHDAVA